MAKEAKIEVEVERFHFSEYTMFMPRGANALKNDYKELEKEELFKNLTNNELVFCWFYGHEASPLFECPEPRLKATLCYEYSFERIKCISNKPDKSKYIVGNFPSKIKDAIVKMNSYKMGPRALALKVMDRTMQNISNLSMTDINGPEFYTKDGEVDFTKKNAFINAMAKANETMPILIDRMENGYSVRTVKALKEDKGSEDFNFMDNIAETTE